MALLPVTMASASTGMRWEQTIRLGEDSSPQEQTPIALEFSPKATVRFLALAVAMAQSSQRLVQMDSLVLKAAAQALT